MRLLLGKVPADFDSSSDVVAGPWCFLSEPASFERWSKIDFLPDPGDGGEQRAAILFHCTALAERLLIRLVPELNRINETDHSLKFWRIMTMWWLLSLVQLMFFAQERAKALNQAYGNLPLDLELVEKNVEWHFQNTPAFCSGASYFPDFFAWMLSRFLEKNLPVRWNVRYTEKTLGRSHSKLKVTGNFREWLRDVIWTFRLRAIPRCVGVYGIRDWRSLILSLLLFVKKPLASWQGAPYKPESQKKEPQPVNLLSWMTEDEVLALVWDVMPVSMKHLRQLPQAWWRRQAGKIRLVGPLVLVMDKVQYAIALSAEAGEVIIGSQHGAMYGSCQPQITASIEYNLDAFITWGWGEHEGYAGRFIPLPSPWLSRGKHKQTTNELLFVGTIIPLVRARSDAGFNTATMISYVRMKREFLEKIDHAIFDHMVYRPHLAAFGLDETLYLKQHFPSINILNTLPEARLFSCRLLVMDNSSTVLHIALAANIPTVCYWKRGVWPMTAAAEIYYDLLVDAGIVFHDPVSAAEQINRIWPNVQGWWQSDKVQHARDIWCRQFALADTKWFSIWIKTLWKLQAL